MTSRKRSSQFADEDEGKRANLKEKSSSEKNFTVLENSSLQQPSKLTLFTDYPYREEKTTLLKTVGYNTLQN